MLFLEEGGRKEVKFSAAGELSAALISGTASGQCVSAIRSSITMSVGLQASLHLRRSSAGYISVVAPAGALRALPFSSATRFQAVIVFLSVIALSNMAGMAEDIAGNALHGDRSTAQFVANTVNTATAKLQILLVLKQSSMDVLGPICRCPKVGTAYDKQTKE